MTATPHAERAHAEWSASAASRNMACAGALALSKLAPEQKESEAAAWGTACHEVAEWALNSGQDCDDFPHPVIKTKQHTIPFDDEIAECAQVYVDYVRDRQSGLYKWTTTGLAETVRSTDTGPADWMKVEQKFSLADIKPPLDAGGTADAVLYFSAAAELEVVDLKGGRGIVVEAKGNDQLRHYALGAMLANPGINVRTVRVTIVQPRIGHAEGRIRSEAFHAADLLDWTTDLLLSMTDAYGAIRILDRDGAASPRFLATLNAGNHCTFCPAKQAMLCPVIQQKALTAVGVWFSPDGAPTVPDKADITAMSPEKLRDLLDVADFVEGYFNAVRAYAHAQAENGVDIPDYQLVAKQARAKWAEGAETQVYGLGVSAPEDVFFERKLRSPAQARKAYADEFSSQFKTKKDAEAHAAKLLEPLLSRESSGTNLVRKDKTTRVAIQPKADRFFSPVIEGEAVAVDNSIFD